MTPELADSKHWTLHNPVALSWEKQREMAIQRVMVRGHIWCPVGHWVERSTTEPHVHHLIKKSHWVDPRYSHILPNLVPFCSQHHLPSVFPWHDERPHFLMRVFATTTGGEFSLLSRHRDQYMSWPRVRLAVIERDGHQCQCCGARQRYIERPLYSSDLSDFITYSGRKLRPYHLANPNERPTIAHLTDEMTTLCFDCYWHDGGEVAPNGWRKQPYQEWQSFFG